MTRNGTHYTTLLVPNILSSVIDDRCDIRTAFNRVVHYFDPNCGRNRKTKVLDMSNAYFWSEKDMRMFDVVKTNRLTGTALEKKYGIIIYEPPKNKAFMTSMKDNSKKLKRLLVPHGILIGKVADFKDKGQRLRGSYDMKEVFEHAGFFLTDQIIYRYNHTTMDSPEAKEAKIVHSYFMIFKPKRT